MNPRSATSILLRSTGDPGERATAGTASARSGPQVRHGKSSPVAAAFAQLFVKASNPAVAESPPIASRPAEKQAQNTLSDRPRQRMESESSSNGDADLQSARSSASTTKSNGRAPALVLLAPLVQPELAPPAPAPSPTGRLVDSSLKARELPSSSVSTRGLFLRSPIPVVPNAPPGEEANTFRPLVSQFQPVGAAASQPTPAPGHARSRMSTPLPEAIARPDHTPLTAFSSTGTPRGALSKDLPIARNGTAPRPVPERGRTGIEPREPAPIRDLGIPSPPLSVSIPTISSTTVSVAVPSPPPSSTQRLSTPLPSTKPVPAAPAAPKTSENQRPATNEPAKTLVDEARRSAPTPLPANASSAAVDKIQPADRQARQAAPARTDRPLVQPAIASTEGIALTSTSQRAAFASTYTRASEMSNKSASGQGGDSAPSRVAVPVLGTASTIPATDSFRPNPQPAPPPRITYLAKPAATPIADSAPLPRVFPSFSKASSSSWVPTAVSDSTRTAPSRLTTGKEAPTRVSTPPVGPTTVANTPIHRLEAKRAPQATQPQPGAQNRVDRVPEIPKSEIPKPEIPKSEIPKSEIPKAEILLSIPRPRLPVVPDGIERGRLPGPAPTLPEKPPVVAQGPSPKPARAPLFASPRTPTWPTAPSASTTENNRPAPAVERSPLPSRTDRQRELPREPASPSALLTSATKPANPAGPRPSVPRSPTNELPSAPAAATAPNLRPARSLESKPDSKTESPPRSKPELKTDLKPDLKTELKPDLKTDLKTAPKPAPKPDLPTPQVPAQHAAELRTPPESQSPESAQPGDRSATSHFSPAVPRKSPPSATKATPSPEERDTLGRARNSASNAPGLDQEREPAGAGSRSPAPAASASSSAMSGPPTQTPLLPTAPQVPIPPTPATKASPHSTLAGPHKDKPKASGNEKQDDSPTPGTASVTASSSSPNPPSTMPTARVEARPVEPQPSADQAPATPPRFPADPIGPLPLHQGWVETHSAPTSSMPVLGASPPPTTADPAIAEAAAALAAPPERAAILEQAAEDPGLSVAVLPHAAHLSILSSSGDLALHVRVRDGSADVNVSGTMAALFDTKAPEVRSVLASQGIELGSFATQQHSGSGQEGNPNSQPNDGAQPRTAPAMPPTRHAAATSPEVMSISENGIHVTA